MTKDKAYYRQLYHGGRKLCRSSGILAAIPLLWLAIAEISYELKLSLLNDICSYYIIFASLPVLLTGFGLAGVSSVMSDRAYKNGIEKALGVRKKGIAFAVISAALSVAFCMIIISVGRTFF